jgi:hypothetical protein
MHDRAENRTSIPTQQIVGMGSSRRFHDKVPELA